MPDDNWLADTEENTSTSGPSNPESTQGPRLEAAGATIPSLEELTVAVSPKRPSSKSSLESRPRRDRTLEHTKGIRKRGRPRIVASWFKCVAVAMRDGTPLRAALKRCGFTGLDESQIRALYWNREFRRMYQERRNQRARDSHFKPLTREELSRRTPSRETIYAVCEGRASDDRARE